MRFNDSMNYIEQFLIFDSAFTGFVSFSIFALLVGIPIGISVSSAAGFVQ